VASIVRHYRMHRFQALGPDHESLPVPVPGPEGLRIVRMLAPTRVEEIDEHTQRRWIQPPSYLVAAAAATGAFVEARAVGPADFGQADAPDADLGELALAEDFADRAGRWCALLDELLPAFAAGPGANVPVSAERAAEAKAVFFALAEAPLQPYYRSLGQRFFAFLDRAAGAGAASGGAAGGGAPGGR
jgi:hypothetical protein